MGRAAHCADGERCGFFDGNNPTASDRDPRRRDLSSAAHKAQSLRPPEEQLYAALLSRIDAARNYDERWMTPRSTSARTEHWSSSRSGGAQT
jgi:hypothetical protein